MARSGAERADRAALPGDARIDRTGLPTSAPPIPGHPAGMRGRGRAQESALHTLPLAVRRERPGMQVHGMADDRAKPQP